MLSVIASEPQGDDGPRMAAIEKFDFPILVVSLDRKQERYEYVKQQLDNMGLTKYQKFSAVDGQLTSLEEFMYFGLSRGMARANKGAAACASSHINVWRHIAARKMGWTLILEDDANFHPDFATLFPEYWQQIPQAAKIIFAGHCHSHGGENGRFPIVSKAGMCTHAYMINAESAEYLLQKLLPLDDAVDISLIRHFKKNTGAYLFNGNATVSGIRPNDYKEKQGQRCSFNGLIYQNQETHPSTIR